MNTSLHYHQRAIISTPLRLLALVIMLLALISMGGTAQAAPLTHHSMPDCDKQRKVNHWKPETIKHEGFFKVVNGSGELSFNNKKLSLALNPTQSTAPSTARIQDYLPDTPETERCWQVTERNNIVAEFEQRYLGPPVSGTTANNVVWNAPAFVPQGITFTTIGMTRNSLFGAPRTYLTIALKLQFPTFQSEVFQMVPVSVVAPWLVETDWHTVRIVIEHDHAEVSVSQRGQTGSISADLPSVPGPLGIELSIDNEVAPGVRAPVATRTGVEIGKFEIGYERNRDRNNNDDD